MDALLSRARKIRMNRTFTVLGYMRTIITTDYRESRDIFGKFWGEPGSDCHYAFGADAVGGAQKTRTYVARAVWPPQTWVRVAVHTLESLKTRGFSTFDIRKTPILRLSDPPGPLVLQRPDL